MRIIVITVCAPCVHCVDAACGAHHGRAHFVDLLAQDTPVHFVAVLFLTMTRVRIAITKAHWIRLISSIGSTDRHEDFSEERADLLWEAKKQEFLIVDPGRIINDRELQVEKLVFFIQLG